MVQKNSHSKGLVRYNSKRCCEHCIPYIPALFNFLLDLKSIASKLLTNSWNLESPHITKNEKAKINQEKSIEDRCNLKDEYSSVLQLKSCRFRSQRSDVTQGSWLNF